MEAQEKLADVVISFFWLVSKRAFIRIYKCLFRW